MWIKRYAFFGSHLMNLDDYSDIYIDAHQNIDAEKKFCVWATKIGIKDGASVIAKNLSLREAERVVESIFEAMKAGKPALDVEEIIEEMRGGVKQDVD